MFLTTMLDLSICVSFLYVNQICSRGADQLVLAQMLNYFCCDTNFLFIVVRACIKMLFYCLERKFLNVNVLIFLPNNCQ